MMTSMEQFGKILGSEIRKARLKQHMDQQALADFVDITRSSISNIESGRQSVSLKMFCKLSQALTRDPAEFLNTILTEHPEAVSQDDTRKGIESSVLDAINKSLLS